MNNDLCESSETGVKPMSGRLYACTQCAQGAAGGHSPPQVETFVERLAGKVGCDAPELPFRKVRCLNGCPAPCTVALRAPGKWSYRLSGLVQADVDAVVALAQAYALHPSGDLPAAAWPSGLDARVTVRTPPLSARASVAI